MPFPNTRSLFALSAAGRAVVSITGNTIAPLMDRLGETVARNRNARVSGSASAIATSPQRQVPASDEIKRQQAQDEQDMFDAQMMSVPIDSGSHQQTAVTMRDSAQGDRE
jgi:3-polyprenyl-4-hydroxybenzoate decarboxylase